MSLEVEYYLTSSRQWLRDYADALSKASGEKVELRGNGLVFPPSIAEGRYESHELAEGLTMWVVDCTYHTQITQVRRGVLGNDHYSLVFNVSDDSFLLHKQNGRIVESGKDLSNAIFFSSQSYGTNYVIKAGTHIRSIGLLFHYDWAYEIFSKSEIPVRKSRMAAIVNKAPIQFTVNMDLKIQSIIEELFACRLSYFIKLKYYEGIALQLFSLFLKNVTSEESDEERFGSAEAARIRDFKQILDAAIDGRGDIPSMEDAVESCYMSKVNFSKLFQSFYGKNYSDYIRTKRIQRAAQLIESGYNITDAGHEIGYANLGHFARVFGEEIGMTPKKYQQSLKAKENTY